MSKANNLVFDDGYKEFTINNDPARVIRFNPSDVAIVERLKKSQDALEALVQEFGENEPDDMAAALERLDNAIKKEIDTIFNQPVSGIVFGNQSPMSPVKGVPLFERFFDAVLPVIMEGVKEEKKLRQQRVSKYVKAAKGK